MQKTQELELKLTSETYLKRLAEEIRARIERLSPVFVKGSKLKVTKVFSTQDGVILVKYKDDNNFRLVEPTNFVDSHGQPVTASRII